MSVKAKGDYLLFLDGLRAVAVGLVIVFHYWANGAVMCGGFVGVDVFFDISGFIITRSLMKECQDEEFSLKSFWIRRSKRLLPAVSVLLFILIALSVACPMLREGLDGGQFNCIVPYIPDLRGELASIKSQFAAVILHFTNWYLVFNDVSYFEQMNRPSLLTHLWSLAIEEQFYFIWPVFIFMVLAMCKKNRKMIAICVIVPLVASLAMMVIAGQAAPKDARAYYGTDCRAFALLLGALLAVFWDLWDGEALTGMQRCFVQLAGLAGLAIVGYLGYSLKGGELFAFRGGLFGAAFGAAMIIVSGKWEGSTTSMILGNNILRWIGRRSYGLYLWHWPIFILTDPAYNFPLEGFFLLLFRSLLLIGIVQISYKYIETPIRVGVLEKIMKTNAQNVWRLAGTAFVSMTLVVFCSVAVVTAKPDSGQFGRPQMEKKAAVLAAKERSSIAPENQDVVQDKQVVAAADPDSDSIEKADMEQAEPDKSIVDEKPADTDETSDRSKIPSSQQTDKNRKAGSKSSSKANKPGILAIGDSVMLGAKPALEEKMTDAYVDAKVGRQFATVVEIIKSLKRSDKIPPVVVIHSGTNGTIDENQFSELMELLRPCKRVVVVNLYVPRPWQKRNNEIIEKIVLEYANAQLADWREACLEHRQYLYKDGIHIGERRGANMYAQVIKDAMQ